MAKPGVRGVKGLAAAALILAVLAAMLAVLPGMRGAAPLQSPAPEAEASPLESYTGFSLRFSLLAGLGERNTAVSPFSVYPAMLMLSEGSAGEAKAEILRALGLSSQAEAREWFRSSSRKFLSAEAPAKTSIANSLWVREGVPVRGSYAEALARYYLAEHYSFASPGEAVQRINSWVSEKTGKLIDRIVDFLDPLTVVVLVNTVYFKANWTTPFESVVRDVFNSPDGPVQADYLSGVVPAKVYESEDLTAVALGYTGTGVKFVVLMPRKQALREFVSSLSKEELLGILSELLSRDDERVRLLLPKFDVDSGILELSQLLKSMGVRKVFDPEQADLSGMFDYSKLPGRPYVSEVFHRARVRVDLYGTEAAAATAVVIRVTAVPPPARVVKIDKPFAFLLVDPDTKAVLFAGSIVKP
jgi:serpin B